MGRSRKGCVGGQVTLCASSSLPAQSPWHQISERESRRRSEQQCLNERGKQVTEAIRAGRTVAWDRQDERRMRQG